MSQNTNTEDTIDLKEHFYQEIREVKDEFGNRNI